MHGWFNSTTQNCITLVTSELGTKLVEETIHTRLGVLDCLLKTRCRPLIPSLGLGRGLIIFLSTLIRTFCPGSNAMRYVEATVFLFSSLFCFVFLFCFFVR